jgi:four helix bundle protein
VRAKFFDLIAYQRAVALADELHAVVPRWPSLQRYSVGAQLLRAADSIGANIAEAFGRWHRADQRRLLYIARGSVYETQHWLARAEKEKLVRPGTREKAEEIARILNGLIRSHAERK